MALTHDPSTLTIAPRSAAAVDSGSRPARAPRSRLRPLAPVGVAALADPITRARELLESHGLQQPEQRFDLEAPSLEHVRDALSTQLMDLFRRTRDRGVFELLVEVAGGPLVRRVRCRLRSLALDLDPSEIQQDALVNVYQYPDRFDGSRPGAFRAWSSTIVDNTIRRQLRRARTGPDIQFRAFEVLSQEPEQRFRDPGMAAQQGEECRVALAALNLLLHAYLQAYGELSERERFVLQMVEVRGMRYAELAKILEIRPEALKMVVFRARRRIHERLMVIFARAGIAA